LSGQVIAGIDPGPEHFAVAVAIGGELLISRIHWSPAIPRGWRTNGYLRGALVVLEWPTEEGVKRYLAGGLRLRSTVETAQGLRDALAGTARELYCPPSRIIRRDTCGWHSHLGKADPFIRAWLRSLGYSRGQTSDPDFADALLARWWGRLVADGRIDGSAWRVRAGE
jgi:hypothetical protein